MQKDRVDQSAKGWSESQKVDAHASQVDHKKGFGGKFGVETDRVDASAKGWSESQKVDAHSSQVNALVGAHFKLYRFDLHLIAGC